MTHLAAHGVAVEVPHGWEGRIVRRPSRQPARAVARGRARRVVPDARGARRLRRRRHRAHALGRRVRHAVRVRTRVGRHSRCSQRKGIPTLTRRPCSRRAACSARCPARSVASSSSPRSAARSASTSWSPVASTCARRSTQVNAMLAGAGPVVTPGAARSHRMSIGEGRRRREQRARAPKSSRRGFLFRSTLVGSALAVNPWRFLLQPGHRVRVVVRTRRELLVGLDRVLLLDQQRAATRARPAASRPAGGRPTGRASATAGRATSSTATRRADRAVAAAAASARPAATTAAATAAPARATSASCAATSSATASAIRSSRASGRSCAGSRRAGRRGRSIPTCTTASATANETALHTAPCLDDNATAFVSAFGGAPKLGAPKGQLRSRRSSASPRHRRGRGYWLVASDGGVFTFGDAQLPRLDRQPCGSSQPIVGIARDAARQGLLARRVRRRHLHVRRRALPRLHRQHPAQPADRRHGADAERQRLLARRRRRRHLQLRRRAASTASTGKHPAQPTHRRHGADTERQRATGSSRPTAASSRFGDAQFHGSTGSIRLTQPIVGMAAHPQRQGLLARRGRRRHLHVRRRAATTAASARTGGAKGRAVGMARRPRGGYWIASQR